jgi:hypothetical protein
MATANSVSMKFDNGKNFNVTINKSGVRTYSHGSTGEVQIAANGGFNSSGYLVFDTTTNTLTAQNITVTGNITVPANSFKLAGGNSGQLLSTDGSGNLTWIDNSSGASGSTGQVQIAAADGSLAASDQLSFASQTLTVAGAVVPYTTLTYDLGSPTRKWKDIHLSGNTIYLGETSISADPDGGIQVPSLSTSGAIQAGNISVNEIVTNTIAGVLTTSDQPGITSVGPLERLVVKQEVEFQAANVVTANYFSGTIDSLSGYQPNITSVGTLQGLSVTGTISATGGFSASSINTPEITTGALNVSAVGTSNLGNAAHAGFFVGDGRYLSNLQVGSYVSNGSSKVEVLPNAAITFRSNGVANVMVVDSTGVNIASNVQVPNVNTTTVTATTANVRTLNASGNVNATDLYVSDSTFFDGPVEANSISTTHLSARLDAQVDGTLTAQRATIVDFTVLEQTDLNSLGNIKITGGANGQSIVTDGRGGLRWEFTSGNLGTPNSIFGGGTAITILNDGNIAANVNGVSNVVTLSNSVLKVNAISNLGLASNVKIGGGMSGQQLTTDGTGNLRWSSPPVGVVTIKFDVPSNANNQSFTSDLLRAYNSSNTAVTVTRNGVVVDPENYTVVNNTLYLNTVAYSGDEIIVLPSGPTSNVTGSSASGTVTAVTGTGGGLGFSLDGYITDSGNITLTVPSAANLRQDLALGNISTVNLVGNSAKYLRGDGSWSTIAVSGSSVVGEVANAAFATATDLAARANVATLADVATTALGVNGSNVSGTVASAANSVYADNAGSASVAAVANLATVATTAYSVDAANINGTVAYSANSGTADVAKSVAGYNVTGNVAFAEVANSVALANVVGAGNIASINITGNSGQVFLGNGTFAAVPAAGTEGQLQFNSGGTINGANITWTDSVRLSVRGQVTSSAENLSPFSGYRYSNDTTQSVMFLGKSRGTRSVPASIQAGDQVAGVSSAAFVGNTLGTVTLDGSNGWTPSFGLFSANVTALPTVAGGYPDTLTAIITSNSAANLSRYTAVFDTSQQSIMYGNLVMNSGGGQKATQYIPTTATSAGAKGQIAYDTNYVYICVAANTWKRSALTTW